MKKEIICASLLAGLSPLAVAETVLLEATQDNTLYQSPSGRLSNGSGDHLFAGLTAELEERRAVIAFKDLDTIPADASITSVKLHLRVSRENSGPRTVRLHRLTSNWGEGASHAVENEGRGANSETGDATWVHRFWPNLNWSEAGGDFVALQSAELIVNLPGDYTFGSTSDMVSDAQQWLDNPQQNFGWILIGNQTLISAKRFDSRENSNPANRPVLEVTYTTTGSPFDFSGIWYDPELDGEGYNVYQTPVGWLIYFFGYSADEEFLWVTSDVVNLDNLVFGEPFELPMLIGDPGTFAEPTPSTGLMPYGTLSVTFLGCTTGVFVLDGLDVMKTSNVVKLVGVDGTDCEES
jgi:hypothetical protein